MLESWASKEDFATLFQYFWYRDFPLDQAAIGARRSDWTIHTGIVVRNIADLMGLVTRFESGKRKDAVLRSAEGDEIAIEWEWGDVLKWINASRNEVEKLRDHKARPKGKERLKYAVLITYTHTPYIQEVYKLVKAKWEKQKEGARWPLLLILIDVLDVPKPTFFMGREFKNIQMSVFDKGKEPVQLRSAPAFPWEVPGTRLCINWSNRG
jgi:hypothetical protein